MVSRKIFFAHFDSVADLSDQTVQLFYFLQVLLSWAHLSDVPHWLRRFVVRIASVPCLDLHSRGPSGRNIFIIVFP